jgi:putative transposase
MMWRLAKSAEKRWRKLNGHEQIPLLLEGKKFVHGILSDAA